MTRGVLMYAHNNTEIDYLKIACANALMVRKNLGVPVSVVTDQGSLRWCEKSLGKEFIENCFDKILVKTPDHTFENIRNYSDTSFSTKQLKFYNCRHWEAFQISPYDETLFIDSDYLIMSPALNLCWGGDDEFLINSKIFTPGEDKDPYFKHIDDFGIRQYWATVIYFRKTLFSKFIFELVQHIEENYNYYHQLYYFSTHMFRNDYAFSIAIHMLNGFSESTSIINELPIPGLLMSWDTNDIYKLNGLNDITLYTEKQIPGTYTLSRLKNQDVHIMNKWSVSRVADELIKIYS